MGSITEKDLIKIGSLGEKLMRHKIIITLYEKKLELSKELKNPLVSSIIDLLISSINNIKISEIK